MTINIAALVEHVEHTSTRFLQEIVAEATAGYWHRRAEAFESSRPRAGDYPGQSTLEQRREAWRRCDQAAKACRAKAAVALREVS